MKRSDNSNVPVFGHGIETGTCLAWFEVAVAVYLGIGIELAQLIQQTEEGCTLGECAGVLGGFAVRGTAADVADDD